MSIKKIISYIFILVLLQLYRIIGKAIIFSFIEQSLMNDMIVNIILVGIMLVVMIILGIKNRIFKISNKYVVMFLLVLCYIFTMPFVKVDTSLYTFLSLLYNCVITVLYEEIIFRGLLWKDIEIISNKKWALVLTIILFAIWHIGYIDTILYRTALFNSNANILNIMFWKVVTSLVLGIIFSGIRYKSNNVNIPIIFHMLINVIMS